MGAPPRDGVVEIGGVGCRSGVGRGGCEGATVPGAGPDSHGGSGEGDGGNDRRCSGTPDGVGARLWVVPPISGGAVGEGWAGAVGVVIGGGGEAVSRARNSRNSVRRVSIALLWAVTPKERLSSAAVSCSFVRVGIVVDTPDDTVSAADGTVREVAVESDGVAADGGVVVDGGGAAEAGGGGSVAEAAGREPDITDTRLIGLRVLPEISLNE
jgi:hypothetical protein